MPPLGSQIGDFDEKVLRLRVVPLLVAKQNRLHTKGEVLVIPFDDVYGASDGYAAIRPHNPKPDREGKIRKYILPEGKASRPYFPVDSRKALLDSHSPIFITEGPIKALALSAHGLTAIGLMGVWNWKVKNTDDLHPWLADLPWKGRRINIVFDYDPKLATREHVSLAARRLAAALRAVGAEVYRVELPPGPNGEKQGVDDFLASHGPVAFGELVARAEPFGGDVAGNSVIKIIPVTPPVLGEDAYYGPTGDFLRTVDPYTEATDAGVLAHWLATIGTLAGSGPYIWAGGEHFPRLHVGVVGRTSTGRKGTSAVPVDLLMRKVDRDFWEKQRKSGLASGEGLIAYVADKITKDGDGNEVVEPVEKRLIVVEPELSRALVVMRRDGNVLSQIIREAFDSGNLATMTVVPRHAAGAHISIVGHITPEELEVRLSELEMANGWGNRFLWFLVESDKVMPKTAPIPDGVLDPFVALLRPLMKWGSLPTRRLVEMDHAAEDRWNRLYPELRTEPPGLFGAMTARGSALVLRVALIYALIDWARTKRLIVRDLHLKAAYAVWQYSRESAEYLFGSVTGDRLQDRVLRLLEGGPMTKSEFNRHLSPKQKAGFEQAMEKLVGDNLVQTKSLGHPGGGRPSTMWERVR
jgi:hypothetical protein